MIASEFPEILWKPRALAEACAGEGVSVEAARGLCRCRDLVRARWRVMAALRAQGWSLTRIGHALRRDHTTVLYGLRKLAKLAEAADGQA